MRLNIRPSGDAGPPNVSLLCLPTRNANERTLLTTTRTKHRQLTFILNHIRHFFLVSLSTLRSSPAPSPLLKACAPASSFLRAYLSIRFSPRTNDGQTTRPSNLFASVIFSNRFLASLLALSISSSSLKFSSTENWYPRSRAHNLRWHAAHNHSLATKTDNSQSLTIRLNRSHVRSFDRALYYHAGRFCFWSHTLLDACAAAVIQLPPPDSRSPPPPSPS